MWLHQYDYDFVKQLCKYNNISPDVTVVVNTLCNTTEQLKKIRTKRNCSKTRKLL